MEGRFFSFLTLIEKEKLKTKCEVYIKGWGFEERKNNSELNSQTEWHSGDFL